MSASRLIFVYGTLKRGGSNHHFLADQVFVGAARTAPGFRLHDLGGYPGMVPHAGDRDGVAGEIWEVDDACLRRLDGLEGLAEGLYRRARVPLLPPFADRGSEGYLYARSVAGHRDIGGTWPTD